MGSKTIDGKHLATRKGVRARNQRVADQLLSEHKIGEAR